MVRELRIIKDIFTSLQNPVKNQENYCYKFNDISRITWLVCQLLCKQYYNNINIIHLVFYSIHYEIILLSCMISLNLINNYSILVMA